MCLKLVSMKYSMSGLDEMSGISIVKYWTPQLKRRPETNVPTAARLRIRPFWPGHSRGFVVHRDNEMTVLLRRGGGRLEGWSAGCCWSPPAGGSKMAACGRKVSVTLPECLLLFRGLWWYTWRYRSVFSSSCSLRLHSPGRPGAGLDQRTLSISIWILLTDKARLRLLEGLKRTGRRFKRVSNWGREWFFCFTLWDGMEYSWSGMLHKRNNKFDFRCKPAN